MYQKPITRFRLKYPCIRDELLRVFHQIADAETQRQNWVSQGALPRTDTIRLSSLLQRIYISVSLATEPDFTIGLFLKDANEVRLVGAVFYAVEQVFQIAGVDATYESYIVCSEWSNLVYAVDRALQIMQNECKLSDLVSRSQTASKS